MATNHSKVTAPSFERILELLPHRYPFLLVDRIVEISEHKAVTVKNVSVNEPFFAGHFPGRPVMPGVLIVETMAQSAAVLVLSSARDEKMPLFMLTGIDKVRIRRRVVPGDQLRIEVRLGKHHRPLWKFHAQATVDGELAAEADLSGMEVGA